MDECQNVIDDFEELEKLCSDEANSNMGQSESKKNKKAGVETKGTAMSFGFKKKSHNTSLSTANRKSPSVGGLLDKDRDAATVITNPGILKPPVSDNNGNNTAGSDTVDEASTKPCGRLTPRLQPSKKDLHGTTNRSNRFGFRQTNIVRPASAGITPKIAEFDTKQTNANAINNNIYVTDKRRSKSATAPARNSAVVVTSAAVKTQRNPKIDATNTGQMNQFNTTVGGKQYTAIDSGLHTNPIIKPTPKTYSQPSHLTYQPLQPPQKPKEAEPSVTVAKFTLHTTSLPKPQFPVPISLATATNAPAPPPRQLMDIKGAKQAVNISRKELGVREESADSGIASHDDYNSDTSYNQLSRHRYRHLEMVMNGPHRFQVRDLDALTTEPLITLPFPKLPVYNDTNQAVPLSGLVRQNNNENIDLDDNRYAPVEKQDSVGSSDDAESLEEEKLMRDNNASEKSLKGAIAKDLSSSQYSKNSSPGSSRASWCNAGEAMAIKDCSSLSVSSSDESNAKVMQCELVIREEDDMTMSIDPPSTLFSSMTATAETTSSITEPQLLFSDVQSSFNDDTEIIPTNYKGQEDKKFAEMAAAISDGLLLDDETSPTDSLVSSMTESDEVKKNKKKEQKEREKDIDENCTELDMDILSPVTPGTPTHASNSLSLSDGGRDFLIDDEIADQPALVFDDNVNDNSIIDIHSIHLNLSSQHTDNTPTLKDSASSQKTPVVKPRKIMSELYESPLLPRKGRNRRLSKAESLDTLSPCDSIASDDFMLDFDMTGSVDSIDRHPRSNGSGCSHSALHSLDEQQLLSELENKSGEIMREWSTLLRTRTYSNHTTSRESITSQLPARATRLLTRRLQNTCSTPNGSESPRSYDSLPRRALSTSIKMATMNHDYSDTNLTSANSAEDLSLLDKSLRNSMLQDVVHFKKQLVRLRRILQEDEENLMMSDTLNPFDNNNGTFFTPSSDIENKQHENTLIKESGVVALLEDQRQELNDLRRQVVYLQSQIDDKDRTIRMQQNLIEKYEAERKQLELNGDQKPNQTDVINVETISIATQTERLRPLSIGQDGLARSEHQITTNGQPPQPQPRNGLKSSISNSPSANSPTSPSNRASNLKPKTQISSIYTQLSSIKHSNPTNGVLGHKKSASLTLPTSAAKTVRTTLIGNSNTATFGKLNQNGPSSPTTPTKTIRNPPRPTLNLNGNLTTAKVSMNGRKVAKTPPSSPIIVMENGTYKHLLQSHFLNGNGIDEKLVDDLNNQINLTKIN